MAILEVGLGGRLDAVNIIAAELAIVTSVGIDHTEWLGDTREKIGFEKAGIFRPLRPAVCVDPNPPESLLHMQTAKNFSVLPRTRFLLSPSWKDLVVAVPKHSL